MPVSDVPYKSEFPAFEYVPDRVNPQSIEELAEWCQNEFEKIGEILRAWPKPAYGAISIDTDTPLSLTTTPLLVAPYQNKVGENMLVEPDLANGALEVQKGATGVYAVFIAIELEVASNKTYTLHLFRNGVSTGTATQSVKGSQGDVAWSFLFPALLYAGDKIDLRLAVNNTASVTVEFAELFITRIG